MGVGLYNISYIMVPYSIVSYPVDIVTCLSPVGKKEKKVCKAYQLLQPQRQQQNSESLCDNSSSLNIFILKAFHLNS